MNLVRNISEVAPLSVIESWRNVTPSHSPVKTASSEIAALSILFVTAVLGNVAVLIALYFLRREENREKLSRFYFFILHLSVADLVTAVLNVLPQLLWKVTYRFAGGPPLCKVVRFGQTLGPYLLVYILVATALDRHQAVCSPVAYRTRASRRSRTMVVMAWAGSLVFALPQVTIFSYQQVSLDVHDCWASFPHPWGERVYVTWYCLSVFVAPLGVLLVACARMCHRLWLSEQRPHARLVGTAQQTVAVAAVFALCTAPFICALLWAVWDADAFYSPLWAGSTLTTLTLLCSVNSCVNPCIYLAFNADLARALRHALTACVTCRGGEARHGAAVPKTSAQMYRVDDGEREEREEWGTIHEEDDNL